MSGLDGKVAVVTGGSRGIGAAIAKRFAADGADVVVTYVGNKAAADTTVGAIRAVGRRSEAFGLDAADTAASQLVAREIAATFGGIDIIVHSAGISEFISIAEASEEAYLDASRRHFDVNLHGVAAMTAAALPHMRDGGRVVIVGSVNAHQMPFAGTAVYGASKAAVAAMAQGWARDLGGRGILVNVIQPGPIHTEMNPDDERDVARIMKGMTALKRFGRVEEIAALAAFLASDQSSYITGTTIDIDGGFSV